MFLQEIKNTILTSKQLEVKSESFSKLNRYFGKEIDDFSFKVEDTIELVLDFGEKEYSINYLPSDKNLENDFYYFIVNEALKEVKFNDASINYLFDLGVRNCYKLTLDFLIELKHSFDVEGFEVKKLHRSQIKSLQRFQNNLISLNYRIPYEEESYIGFLLEQDEFSLNIIEQLKKDRDYLIGLESELKNVLLDSIHETSPSKKEFITVSQRLVNIWLDNNCSEKVRNLIQINPHCYYFSLNEEWLMPIDYLNSKCEYRFEGPKQGA